MVYFRQKSGEDVKNFDNVAYPAKEELKKGIIDRRKYIVALIQYAEERQGKGAEITTHRLRAALIALYYDIYSSINASLTTTTKKLLYSRIHSHKYLDLIAAWEVMSDYLYKKNLTVWDSQQNIDFNDMEAENESKGQ